MSFVAPVSDLPGWQWRSQALSLPEGLRFSDYTVRSLRGQRASNAEVRAPCSSAVRHVSVPASAESPGFEVLQLTPLANRFRGLAQAIGPGLPTFCFLLPPGTVPLVLDHQLVGFDDPLASVNEMQFAIVFADRILREPVFSSDLLLAAINDAPGDLDDTSWRSFTDAVRAATSTADDAPVILMDHAGQAFAGSVDVTVDGEQHQIELSEGDSGDLQAAIARLHAADPSNVTIPDLWGRGATSATISRGGSAQFARMEDSDHNADTMTVSKTERHVMSTDLDQWFAAQFATPTNAPSPSLERFTRGNRVVPLVNGVETFADMFAELDRARHDDDGAFHLAGWSIFADEELTERPEGAPEDFPLTLEQVSELLKDKGGSRYLAVDFITVSDPSKLTSIEVMAVYLLVAGQLLSQISAPRDGSGIILALAVWITNLFIIEWLSSDDFKQLEPNQKAIDTLDTINNTIALLSPVPTTLDDNPLADVDNILHGAGETLFEAIRHFSVYHQKIGIVRGDSGFVGYCGGIDFNPNRLDDDRHLNLSPYHDVHARLEGPAVRDLIVTVHERWQDDQRRLGTTDAPAFDPDDAINLQDRGDDIVQIARTYGTATDNARRLQFAPAGDRTLLDTTLDAIEQAREYIYIEDQYLTPPKEYLDVLVNRISSGALKKVIVVIPVVGDQPFGDARKTEVIDALRDAAADAGDPNIVRVGSPRRHFTTPTSDLRASSGRVSVMVDVISDITGESILALGPPNRLPPVPFWVSVNGELIWVYDESLLPNSEPENMTIFRVARGDETRILSGIPPGKGAHPREHKIGSAATIVNMDGIYVHAKLMLIDDVFLSIGSANLNRRGFYSDGECNIHTVPAGLRATNGNPVRALRKRLWAEMLDIPLSMANPLLEDPVESSRLFDRSYFLGNRFVRAEAFPKQVMLRNFAGGDGLVFAALNYLGFAMLAGSEEPLFDTVVDPSSDLDPHV